MYRCISVRMNRLDSSALSSQAKTQAVMIPSKPISASVPKKSCQGTSP